jgi:F0F1-type ATP synthase epsilon subunit
VLAEQAVPAQDFDPTILTGEIKSTEQNAAAAKNDSQRDKLTHRVDQLKALRAGLTR